VRLSEYDFIVLNSSAGKDSQTLIRRIVSMARAESYPKERIIVAHADLGRMEWPGTRELAEYQAASYGLKFWVKARPQGDLLHHAEERGMWPSSQQRWCTSDHKRGQIGTLLTSLGQNIKVLNCLGMRAQESPARAKLKPLEINRRYSNTKRHVDQFLPIHGTSTEEVWQDIHSAPIPYHYAYDLGMPRLSCIFCIFSPRNALVLAGQHNRGLLSEYVGAEHRMGHTFRVNQSLAEVQAAIVAGEEPGKITDWKM
jgi:3'-phosphoadenosine 5'-phosphosulfate sulfotransferase (PAPS reductase)/FAD synthetase